MPDCSGKSGPGWPTGGFRTGIRAEAYTSRRPVVRCLRLLTIDGEAQAEDGLPMLEKVVGEQLAKHQAGPRRHGRMLTTHVGRPTELQEETKRPYAGAGQ